MSRFAKGLLGTALLAVGLQVLVSAGGDHRPDVALASNVLGICLAMLAASAALTAARVSDRYARWFWLLNASGFAILTTAELLGTYYDSILHASVHSAWPSDIFYFLFPAPMVLALFLRRGSRGPQGINWAQCFDFLQVGILTAAVYLYYFYLPSHWQASAPEMERLQWRVAIARDVFLVIAFAFRLTFVRSKVEWSLLSRLGGFLGLFGLGSAVYVHRQMTLGMDSGTGWDLCYTLPLAAAIAGACTWKLPTKAASTEERVAPRQESLGSLWMSVLLPLIILGVASRMAHERPLLATVLVVVTLASSGARSLLTQRQEQQAAHAMVEAEKKFRVLFQDNPQPTILYDPATGRFLEVNQAATEKYGYTRDEFLSLMVADVCLDLPPERMAAARMGIEIRGEVWRQRRKDGSIFEVVLFARTIEFEGRKVRLVVTQDITERRRAERLQSALYRIAEVSTTARDLTALYPAIHAIVAHLLDAKNFYIALYEPEANSLTFPYFVDEFDLAPAPRAPKKGLTEYVLRSGEPLLATGEKLNELAAAGEVERTGSPADDWLGVPLKRGDITFGVLAVQHYAARTHFGERERDVLTFVSQQVANAIERKRSEEALLRSESRYRSLVQSAVVGIFRATREWRFLEVNPALATMLGYASADELLVLSFQQDVFVDERAKAAMQTNFLRRGRFEGVEARWRRKNGVVITVRLSGRGVRDEREGTEVFEVIAEDVTERKGLEEQLRQAQKMEAVGTLAGGVAHDFNNLLTVISGYSQILLEQHAQDAQSNRSIEQIFRAAERATSLTRQLLAFSRRQMLQPRVVNLNTLIRNLEKMLHPLLGERIQIVLRAGHDLGAVRADPGQLEHILMNLAVNARDAMPRGGTLVIQTANEDLGQTFARSHPGAAPGLYVVLSVTDTGTGMDAHALAHLFEPFFTTKEPGKGTGLGLSMVYGIVKQSGGYISVDSELGRGTTFRVYLPRVDEAEERRAVEATPATRKAGSGTILLVEDEDAVRSLVETILASGGYKILVADSPAQAAEICRTYGSQIDVLLTDVVMPDMSGPELAEGLLALRPGLKVVYMSGYAGDYLDEQGVDSDGVALLQKPFTAGALEERIRQVLNPAVAR
jgi:two-component system, cell cycle sensor histidine kinase and response regulator CckA